jgi:hypothetical protein
MERELLLAALRVIMSLHDGTRVSEADIGLLKANALPGEIDFDLDDLARNAARRVIAAPKAM